MHSEAMESAYALLERSIMTHNGEPVGTVAAVASGDVNRLTKVS